MNRRNFFGRLAGSAAAIAALWSAPKQNDVNAYDVAVNVYAKTPCGSRLVWMSEPGRLLVCGSELWFGDDSRIYEAGFVHIPEPGRWHIYTDDPNFRGGKVKYQATMKENELYIKNGRIIFGSVTRNV